MFHRYGKGPHVSSAQRLDVDSFLSLPHIPTQLAARQIISRKSTRWSINGNSLREAAAAVTASPDAIFHCKSLGKREKRREWEERQQLCWRRTYGRGYLADGQTPHTPLRLGSECASVTIDVALAFDQFLRHVGSQAQLYPLFHELTFNQYHLFQPACSARPPATHPGPFSSSPLNAPLWSALAKNEQHTTDVREVLYTMHCMS